jgi:hypothetical protein
MVTFAVKSIKEIKLKTIIFKAIRILLNQARPIEIYFKMSNLPY